MSRENYEMCKHFAVALINDDRSGFSGEEDKQLDDWVKSLGMGYFIPCEEEPSGQVDAVSGLYSDNLTTLTFVSED